MVAGGRCPCGVHHTMALEMAQRLVLGGGAIIKGSRGNFFDVSDEFNLLQGLRNEQLTFVGFDILYLFIDLDFFGEIVKSLVNNGDFTLTYGVQDRQV